MWATLRLNIDTNTGVSELSKSAVAQHSFKMMVFKNWWITYFNCMPHGPSHSRIYIMTHNLPSSPCNPQTSTDTVCQHRLLSQMWQIQNLCGTKQHIPPIQLQHSVCITHHKHSLLRHTHTHLGHKIPHLHSVISRWLTCVTISAEHWEVL